MANLLRALERANAFANIKFNEAKQSLFSQNAHPKMTQNDEASIERDKDLDSEETTESPPAPAHRLPQQPLNVRRMADEHMLQSAIACKDDEPDRRSGEVELATELEVVDERTATEQSTDEDTEMSTDEPQEEPQDMSEASTESRTITEGHITDYEEEEEVNLVHQPQGVPLEQSQPSAQSYAITDANISDDENVAETIPQTQEGHPEPTQASTDSRLITGDYAVVGSIKDAPGWRPQHSNSTVRYKPNGAMGRLLWAPCRYEGLMQHQVNFLRTRPFSKLLFSEGGEKILARILSLAAHTVDVLSRKPVSGNNPRHRRPGQPFRGLYPLPSAYPITFVRIETKLRLVCKYWRALIDDSTKVDLFAQPTDTIRVSDSYMHNPHIPIPSSIYLCQPFWSEVQVYCRLQISFVSPQSRCTVHCEGQQAHVAAHPRVNVTSYMRLVELRFPPRVDTSDETALEFYPECYFLYNQPFSPTYRYEIAIKVPFFNNTAHSAWINVFRPTNPTSRKILFPQTRLVLSFDSWRKSQMAALPDFIAQIIPPFDRWKTHSTHPHQHPDVIIELPTRNHVRETMLREWKRQGLQCLDPTSLTIDTLELLNFNTELFHWLFYLANLVPNGVRQAVVAPPKNRPIAQGRGRFRVLTVHDFERREIYLLPHNSHSKPWPLSRVKQWESTHPSTSFDFSIFLPSSASRSPHGLRITAPSHNTSHTASAALDLNDHAHAAKRIKLAMTKKAFLEHEARNERLVRGGGIEIPLSGPSRLAMRMNPENFVLPNDADKIATAVNGEYHRQFNTFAGEVQSWGSLRNVLFLMEGGVKEMRLSEWVSFQELRGVLEWREREEVGERNREREWRGFRKERRGRRVRLLRVGPGCVGGLRSW